MTDIRTNYCVACKEMADRIEALEAENERLREALEWYVAEDEKYIRAARAALAGDSHATGN